MPRFPSTRLRLALIAYGALWVAGLPFVLLYLWRRGRKDADYSRWLAERFGRYGAAMPGAVWVHAVSLGEVRSAVPLIAALLAQGDTVVVSHFTPAGRRETARVFAPQIAAGRLRAVWVPFELSICFKGFWRAFAPKYGLVMEIEIWPRMIMAARAQGVPLLMCNAQYPSKSLARDGQSGLLAQIKRGFAGALVKSDLQAARFASVGVRNIAVTGELRFDQPVPAAQVAAGLAARVWLGAQGRRVITIASAVEGEDAIYVQAIRALRADHAARGQAAPLFVYVPRRPERFNDVSQFLESEGFSVLRRSAVWQSPDPANWGPGCACPDILLGDTLGEMYMFLAMADQVIVGGGFTPKGAHNISEALVMGKPVLTGPQTHTIEFPFVEAEAAGVARSVSDAVALAQALTDAAPPDAAAIARFVADCRGGAARTLAALPAVLAQAKAADTL